MEGFTKKTLKVSRGYNYTYYVSDQKVDDSLPALFFCHGWPDDAHLWEKMAVYLRELPFKLIAPDLLGYAGTDKPTDPAEYKYSGLGKDEIDIIDAEKVSKVIAVGHDWGSAVAARLYNYYPDRVAGLVCLNVVYLPPSSDKFDLDAVNQMTTGLFGYPIYQYWHFFTDPSAPTLLKSKVERLYAALHAVGATSMKDFFTNPKAFENYLNSSDPEPEVREYAKDPAFKKYWIDRLGTDGFEGAQQYYVATRYNHQYECDKDVPQENYKVNVPFLYIGTDQDAVCRPDMLAGVKGFLPDCTEVPIVHAAHWSPYEAPKEMADPIKEWLKVKFLKG